MLLRAQGATGAAQHVWKQAAVFEPSARNLGAQGEQQRVMLLADRAVRVWAARAVALLDGGDKLEPRLGELRVRTSQNAADVGARVGAVREQLKRRPPSPQRPTAAEVLKVLAEVQLTLRNVIDPTRATQIATVHAARALVAAFNAGALGEGISAEAQRTVRILDANAEEPLTSVAVVGVERSIDDDRVHRELVASLVRLIANDFGEVTHAEGVASLPLPPRVGRHRPDALGHTVGGTTILGEAKLGPELLRDEHAQEQLADFSAHASANEHSVFVLLVPSGWQEPAERAIQEAGGQLDRYVRVFEVNGLVGAPPPPPAAARRG